MISPPVNPQRSESISSVREEQSTPQPSSRRSFKMAGVGVALTAKYSRKPGFQAKAACRLPGGFPDALLVVEVEGGGVAGGDGPELIRSDKGLFQGRSVLSCKTEWIKMNKNYL